MIPALPEGVYTVQASAEGYQTAIQPATIAGGAITQLDFALSREENPPVLAPIGDKDVTEGQLLQFSVSATAPAETIVTFSVANLPPGASFDPETQLFTWTPEAGDAGTYPEIQFTVTDNGSPPLTDSEAITITVHAQGEEGEGEGGTAEEGEGEGKDAQLVCGGPGRDEKGTYENVILLFLFSALLGGMTWRRRSTCARS